MNLDHVRLFIRIAALNNISIAGKELGLSPAVSSAHIGKLEADLGVRLIHRTTRRVSLTEEGKAFQPHALELVDSAEMARASVGAGLINPQGKLRVAAPASLGRLHLIPALTNFLKKYPDLQVDIYLNDSVTDMVEGGFDIAIRDAELHDSSLIARKLAPVTRVLCASPSYLLKQGEPKTPEDLINHCCVNLVGLETWNFDSPSGPISIKTHNKLRTDNGEAARDAAVNGLGITLCSTWCCYKEIQHGDLVLVLENYKLISKTAIWAVYPSSRLLAPKVRAFIDYFAEYFSESDYWDKGIYGASQS
ncbi:LysR family transcriptional regulator [Saccharophagus degradans]|uniref:LysR family transcriptional regulator n=1 Tax=Saccharophagus degradans TaxID=86304 RepID=UPI001C08F027|nr:LysR family transcriptional regulator [Saccharophagus degradans]MBU2985643.1 LysR family transcriptional regulator [Saccharophagus degradans]